MSSRARYQKTSTTSREGAEHANKTISLRQRAVLDVIRRNHGATIAEIAKELGVGSNEVSGRVCELRDDHKLIVDSGIKRKTVTPCRGIVWLLHPSVAPFMQIAEDAPERTADVFQLPRVAPASPETCATQADLFGGAA